MMFKGMRHQFTRPRFFRPTLTVLALGAASHSVAGQTYQVVEIPPVQPQEAPAITGINQAGVVCGISTFAPNGSNFYGYFFVDGVGSTRLPKLVDGGPQYVSEVRAINDAGSMAGGGSDTSFVNTAFLASTASPTVLEPLGRPAGSSATDAWSINNAGVVVGWGDTHFDNCTGPFCTVNPGHPLRWSGGGIFPVPTLGGYGALATSINDPGDIVGIDAFLPNPDVRNTRAFLVPSGGTSAIPLTNPLGSTLPTRAYRIKNSGIVLGMADDAAGVTRAAQWTSPLQASLLGTLSGYQHAIALDALTNGNIAIGTASSASLNLQGVIMGFVPLGGRAVLFVRGRAIDLNTLVPQVSGRQLRMANVMNDSGQIAGTGVAGAEHRAFLLNPCGPLIAAPPEAVLACPSATSSGFVVDAVSPVTGDTEPSIYSWQWRRAGSSEWLTVTNGNNLDPSTNQAAFQAAGAITPQLQLFNAETPMMAAVRREVQVTVTNACGSSSSGVVTWSVCPTDFDCSESLSVADVFSFLNAWFAGDARADFDASAVLDVADVFAFLNAWFAGC